MVLVRGILLLSVAVLPVATAETTAAGQEGKIAKNANTGCVAVTGASESGPSVPLFYSRAQAVLSRAAGTCPPP